MPDHDEKQKLIDGINLQIQGMLQEEIDLIAAGCNSAKKVPFRMGISIKLHGPMKEVKSEARLNLSMAKSAASSISTIDVRQMDLLRETDAEA